jgi:hypothetical protein
VLVLARGPAPQNALCAPPPARARERSDGAGTQALLARARQYEDQIRSGRVEIARVTEYNPMTEQDLRELIKDPKELQMELEIAKTMPRRVVERETILFDNHRNQLLTQSTREGGPVAASRGLFTPAFFETYTRMREAPPVHEEERERVFFYKANWPPYSPYDRWRGRSWGGWITAIRKGQITPRRLDTDPRTGRILLLLVGGPGAQLDQKVWVDTARGYTIPRSQAFDKKTGHLWEDERATYRRRGSRLWYLDRLVATYYVYDVHGRQRLSRRETSVVTNTQLNTTLPETAFAFLAPHGAFVQDNRVNPPLVYREGVTTPQPQQRQQEPEKRQRLLVGQPAPDFELASLSGEKIKLADLRGKVVVLNLFAFW